MNCQVLETDQFSNEVMIRHLQADCTMGVRVCCSTREQVKPCSALTMRRMAVMLVLLFPALAFVALGLFTLPDGALPSLNREPNRVHAIRFGSRSRLTRVIIPADNVDGEGEIIEEEITKRQHSRNVRARRLHALVSDGKCNTVATIFRLAVSRRLGPSNDPARLPGRTIKLFIISASSSASANRVAFGTVDLSSVTSASNSIIAASALQSTIAAAPNSTPAILLSG